MDRDNMVKEAGGEEVFQMFDKSAYEVSSS